MKKTIRELAEHFEVEPAVAYGLVKFLAARGHAKEVGTLKKPGAKGKGATVWDVPDAVTVDFKEKA